MDIATRAFCARTKPGGSGVRGGDATSNGGNSVCRVATQPAPVVHHRLAPNLPTDVALIDVGGDLLRPIHQVVVGVRPLEEGALVLVGVNRGFEGVLTPLPLGGHHPRPLNFGGGQDVRGELVNHVEDAGPEICLTSFLLAPGFSSAICLVASTHLTLRGLYF